MRVCVNNLNKIGVTERKEGSKGRNNCKPPQRIVPGLDVGESWYINVGHNNQSCKCKLDSQQRIDLLYEIGSCVFLEPGIDALILVSPKPILCFHFIYL